MDDAHALDMLARLMEATQFPNEASLALFLGISPQAIYQAKKKALIPHSWAVKVAEGYNVSLDWLILKRGSMRQSDIGSGIVIATSVSEAAEVTELKKRMAELEREKGQLERHSKALAMENKHLWEIRLSRDKDVEHYQKIIDGLMAQLQALTQKMEPGTSAQSSLSSPENSKSLHEKTA